MTLVWVNMLLQILTGISDQDIEPRTARAEVCDSRSDTLQAGKVHDDELDRRSLSILRDSLYSSPSFLLTSSRYEDFGACQMQGFRSLKTKASSATCDQDDLAVQLTFCMLVFDYLSSRWALISGTLWVLETLKVWAVWTFWCRHDFERGC